MLTAWRRPHRPPHPRHISQDHPHVCTPHTIRCSRGHHFGYKPAQPSTWAGRMQPTMARMKASLWATRWLAAALVAAAAGIAAPDTSLAQNQPAVQGAVPVPVPGFWDPRRRPERPDISRITLVRFMTEVDY